MGAFTNRPAVKFCTPFMIGILIGWNLPVWGGSNFAGPVGWIWHHFDPIMLAAIFLISAAFFLQTFLPPSARIRPALTFLLIVLFGFVKITFDAWRTPADSVSNFTGRGEIVILRGAITDEPSLNLKTMRFVVDAESILLGGRRLRISGGVLISGRKLDVDTTLVPSLTYGRTVIVSGELEVPLGPRNPGEFDTKGYLHLNGIVARLNVWASDTIILGPEARGNFLASLVYPLRRSAGYRLDRLIGGDEGKFLRGLIIGDRTELLPEIKTAFINSGVIHIIAVSGLHVVIVAMIIIGFLQVVRVPERARIVVTCLLLIYYIFLTGAAASVTRSVIMAIVFLGGKLSERKTDFYNALALSGIIILLFDSKQLLQPGFQLSYTAVFSLVYLYPKVDAMKRFLPFGIGKRRWVTPCVAALSVSLAAGIGTLPLTSIYFGKISLVSFAANIVVVPLSNLILAAGMLTIGISYCSIWLASVYACVTSLLTSCLLSIVSFFGNLPFAYLNSHFTIWSSLAFYGAVGFVITCLRTETRKQSIIALLVVVDLWTCVELLDKPRPLRVTFLAVGQGDGALVELPDGKTILIDAGPEGTSGNAGARFIEPYLRWEGISRLDDIVLSHPHSDHLGGIPYLLRHVAVSGIIDAGSRAPTILFREYLHCIDSLSIPRKVLRGGSRIEDFDGIRLYVLHPSAGFIPKDTTAHSNLNNQSLVIKLVYGRSSVLLAGDAEREAEDRMIDIYGAFLKSDVLKTGHHGSVTSSSDRFLDLVKPAIAIVSVGARNKFHLPSTTVLHRLSARGVQYFRTDESGAVVIESDGEGWTVVNWR